MLTGFKGEAVGVGGADDDDKDYGRYWGCEDDNDEDKVSMEVIMNSLEKTVKTILNIIPLLAAELVWAFKNMLIKQTYMNLFFSPLS